MGGAASRIHTTQRSNILSAQTTDETRQQLILENLIETNWKPVYRYLRGKDCENAANHSSFLLWLMSIRYTRAIIA